MNYYINNINNNINIINNNLNIINNNLNIIVTTMFEQWKVLLLLIIIIMKIDISSNISWIKNCCFAEAMIVVHLLPNRGWSVPFIKYLPNLYQQAIERIGMYYHALW